MNVRVRRIAGLLVGAILASGLIASAVAAAPLERAASWNNPSEATCVAGRKACPIRITFRTGAWSGERSATLTGITSERWFSVRARAGQTMLVVVKGAGPTRGTVTFRNGASGGQPGGRIFDGEVPVTGDVLIRVTESAMAEAWSGRVTVVVLIY